MIKQEKIYEYLQEITASHPHIAIARINKSDMVRKSMGLEYEIDDIDIDKNLGDFPEGAIPYGPIHRELESSPGRIMRLFGNRSRIPFSQAYNSKVGECLEKAILVQLAGQRNRATFLIHGALAQDNEVGVELHAYNILFKNGSPFLIDAQNPLGKDSSGNITHPYIAPVIGIENGDFKFADEWRQGRTYSLS